MENPNSKLTRIAKIIFGTLLLTAVSINIAFAQISEQEYFKQQIAELTKQIAAKPKDDKLYVRRGELFMKLTVIDPFSASADADKALAINPKNQAAIKLKEQAEFQAFFMMGKSPFDEAADEQTTKPTAKPTPTPNAAKPANNIPKPANVPSKPANTGNSDLTKRIAADPNNDQLFVERGNYYLREKKFAEALADAQRALKLRSLNDEALLLRGDIKAAQNDLNGAEADYKQAVKLRNESAVAGRIVSHSGKTIAGIVVKGKILGNSDGYSSLEEIKKDWGIPLTDLKIIVKTKSGKLMVYEGIAAEDNAANLRNAALNEQSALSKEPSIFTGFTYLKLAFDQSLFLPKKDKLTSRQNYEIVDILDMSGLSVVRRQKAPLASGDAAYYDLLEAEIDSKHFEEAKKAYLELEKLFKSANSSAIKFMRVQSLKILYKGDEATKAFVEDEMKKYQFSPEEKRSVKYQPIYV